jgi:hypothetical protein
MVDNRTALEMTSTLADPPTVPNPQPLALLLLFCTTTVVGEAAP